MFDMYNAVGERFVWYEAVIFVICKSENVNSSALTLTSFAKNKWKKNELDSSAL